MGEAFMMNQYDEYELYDDLGFEFDVFGRRDWRTKYNEKQKETKKKYQMEPYEAFDFDAYDKKHKEWKLRQENKDSKKNKDGLQYFDETEPENPYIDDPDWRFYNIG